MSRLTNSKSNRSPLTLRNALFLGAAASVMAIAMPAHAQDGENATAEEDDDRIVVTAQRREQVIDDIGISITAFSGDQLARQGVADARGIAAQTPGLIFDGGSSQGLNAFVTIRGVAQVDYTEHQEMPNAVYLDDVYVPTTSMVGFPVYDMQRVEALRGPQGTLFGRNSTGGLLHFVTTDPGEDTNGFADARYGNYNRVFLEGAVGTRVTDNFSLRVAGFFQQGDGYYKNNNPTPDDNADAFEQDAWGVRAKLRWETDDWSVTATGSVNRSPRHVEGAYKTLPGYVDPVTFEPSVLPIDLDFYGTGPGNDPLGYRDPIAEPHEGSFNSSEAFIKKSFNYVTLEIEGDVSDNISLTTITNYSVGKINYSEDADSTPNQYFNFRTMGDTAQFTQEVRLNGDAERLNWTLGAYYLNLSGDYGTDFDFVAFDFLYPNRYSQDTESWAVFGQVEYELTEQLKATVGLRYTHDSKDFSSVAFEIYPGCEIDYDDPTCQNYDFTTPAVGGLTHQGNGDFAGKIGLDFQATPDLLFYASASRGIRGPGFNATADGYLPIAETPFKNETVHAFEVGTKADIIDGYATFRAAAFYYDYNDYQTFNFNGISSSVSNNDAKFYGGEAELFAKPWEGANIGLGVSLLDATVYGVDTGSGPQNVDPVKAPSFTFNASFGQSVDLGDFQLNLLAEADYMGKHKANLAPSEITDIPASWMTNARIGIGQEQNDWEIYAFVHNIFDVNRKTFGYDNTFAGLALSSYAEPRMYGIGARKSF